MYESEVGVRYVIERNIGKFYRMLHVVVKRICRNDDVILCSSTGGVKVGESDICKTKMIILLKD